MKLENIEKKIKNLTTLEEVLDLAKQYYSLIPISRRSKIFNGVIFQRKTNPEDIYFSLKLATNLSFIFMAYHEKKISYFYSYFRRNDINYEMQIFRFFVMRIHKIYTRQQIDQVDDKTDKNFFTYLNYHFHYPSISVGDYIEMFKIFDDISKRTYGFSVYNIAKLLLFWTSDISIDDETGIFKLTNEWLSLEKMEKVYGIELSSLIVSNLFIDESEVKDKFIYPTEIFTDFKGKIGIKFQKGYFIPQSTFIFESILRYLIETEKSNKLKGNILERHVENLLKDFFDEKNVIKTFYDDSGIEQDILVKYGKYFLSIECKAQDFKEVHRDRNQAVERLTRRFNQVILKGCKQCSRVKKKFAQDEPVIYYDSDKKKKRNVILNVPDTKNIEVLKIVVTLDDYLNLSEFPHDFLSSEYEDTWIVNLFTLKRILWASEPDQFIKYVKYRTSGLKTIRSINSDELEQFGYFVSPNFDIYPQNDLGITINLGQGFSKLFDEYDDYSYQKEMEEWEEHIIKQIRKNKK